MQNYSYDLEGYRKKQSLLTKLSWQRGDHDFLRKQVTRICIRKECTNTFSTKPSDPKKYCSLRCFAVINNIGKSRYPIREKRFCLHCQSFLRRHDTKYCSNKCQKNYEYFQYIRLWKEGKKTGSIGITTRNVSWPLKRYLHEKYGNKCAKCSWGERHPILNKVPLEIEHIDGNSENNREENLVLLCPNCHSLTPFYKNLNKGNGRKWRMDKYVRNSTE